MLRPTFDTLERKLGRPDESVLLLSLATIAVSFLMMFWNLSAQPFWVDEAIAVLPAQSILWEGVPRNPFDLDFMAPQLEDGLWDPSAPLYRYTVAAAAALFGFSEATTRGLSVALGLVLLVPCFLLFRRLYGANTALLACAFLSALPHFADFSREARHFTFVASMMAFTFYFLVDASTEKGSERSRGLWPVFLIATLLGHAIGYLVLPIVGLFLLFTWRRRLLSTRYLPLYLAAFGLYVTVQAKYYGTLPFFQTIGCGNRPEGCHPSLFYYPAVLLSFLNEGDFARDPSPWVVAFNLSLPLGLLVAGVIASARGLRERDELRPARLLVLAWLALPLVLLSTREVKFPRYLFYVLPPMALFIARGLTALRVRTPAIASLAALVVLAPRFTEKGLGRERHLGFESGYVAHAIEKSLEPPSDNWENIRKQVEFFDENLTPGDIVVTSLDDGSLGYYLGRFVYGFLDSEHDDAFFLELLAEARERGAKLYFVDTLPFHDYCHTPGRTPVSISCAEKYRAFYEACLPSSPSFDPTCARLRF